MKKLLTFAILFCCGGFAVAQSTTISGQVKTSQGDFLCYAFVHETGSKTGVYTDTLGSFTLTAGPNAMLRISCFGYRDTLVKAVGNESMVIVMSPVVAISAANAQPGADAGTREMAKQSLSDRIMFNTPVNGNNNVPANYSRAAVAPAPVTIRGDATIPGMVGSPGNPIYDGIAAAMGRPVPDPKSNDGLVQGDAIMTYHEKAETQGSRYFFRRFTNGYIINGKDSLVQSPYFLLNYDKIGGKLLLTKDGVNAVEIFNENVRSFTLFDGLNQPHTFAIVPQVDPKHYVQILADGGAYKICKAVKTHFVAANFATNGLSSSGNNYDEYQDEYSYYLVNVKANTAVKISPRKKSIKQAFGPDGEKADGYFKQNDADIDDGYLASLGEYMNK